MTLPAEPKRRKAGRISRKTKRTVRKTPKKALAEPRPVELENFTSGTLYEEGEYLFSIDSMEMTEDAYVITYRASTDARNYSGYYDMQLIINGVAFHYNDFTFTDENRESNSMIGGGPDRAIRVTLPRTLLAHAGIREVTSVQFDVTLGYSAHSSVYEEVEIRATVYPGAKPAEVDPFPTPKQDSWVLLDNEEGKVQIVDANYWVSAADGHIMGVTFHILTQGKGNGYIALRNLNVGDWTSGKQMGDVNCLLSPGVRYCRITLMGGGDPAEDADYSQSILSYYAYYNEGGTVEELVRDTGFERSGESVSVFRHVGVCSYRDWRVPRQAGDWPAFVFA